MPVCTEFPLLCLLPFEFHLNFFAHIARSLNTTIEDVFVPLLFPCRRHRRRLHTFLARNNAKLKHRKITPAYVAIAVSALSEQTSRLCSLHRYHMPNGYRHGSYAIYTCVVHTFPFLVNIYLCNFRHTPVILALPMQ